MRYTFNRGNWEDGMSLPEWQDNEDYDVYLRRVGYSAIKASFGNENGSVIEIFESSQNHTFYASVCPAGSAVYDVFLPDFPSMMMFIKDYAGAFSAESSNAQQQEILSVLGKLFQIQHGHPAYDICRECDPMGWEQRIRANEEFERQRKERSA